MALGMMGETPVLNTIFHTEINGLDNELDDILDREQKGCFWTRRWKKTA